MKTLEPFSNVAAISFSGLLEASGLVLLFLAVLFFGSKWLPGKRIELADPEDASKTWVLNGLLLFLLLLVILALLKVFEIASLASLHERFFELFVVTNIIAIVATGWVYWRGKSSSTTSQGFLRDFFLGRQLNPTLASVDLKIFCYRPSLIALALFNISFAVVQYERYGELSSSMMLYQLFTFVYILNYFQFEAGMVYTWDIVSERFGFMLVWGDLVVVPFFYCLPGWWLVDASVELHPLILGGLVLLFFFGFWMFRGANQQKHRFKLNPQCKVWGRQAETLEGRLLISGFWGIGRHLNYTGEICIYAAFVLLAASVAWPPLLLLAWLIGLLSHRAWRDERRCREKYGELWDRYKQRARFAMVPYVY